MSFTLPEIAVVFVAFLLGGIMKGATSIGVPLFAVPVVAAYLGLQEAIAVVLMPGLVSNAWQVWQNRKSRLPRYLIWSIMIFAILGTLLGVYVLLSISVKWLNLSLAAIVLVFVVTRLTKPDWQISAKVAPWIAPPAITFGGLMQGATGISSPAVMTFNSALKLPRQQFLMAMSLTFLVSVTTQIPAMIATGLVGTPQMIMGTLALIPMLIGMRVGELILRIISAKAFDRIILVLLTGLAAKLIYSALLV